MFVVAGVLAGGSVGLAAEGAPLTNVTHKVRGLTAKKDLTLTGVISTNAVKVAGKSYTSFVLVTASGEKLHLPKSTKGNGAGGEPAINLADFLGQNVKVVAVGTEKKKGAKVVVRVKTLKTVELIASEGASAKTV